jgi:tetratricopeptide (TPR) repeat protein
LRASLEPPWPDHRDTLLALSGLADTLQLAQRFGDAELHWRELLLQQRKKLTNDSPAVAYTLSRLGECLLRQGKFAEAAPLLQESLAIFEKQQPGRSATFLAQSLLGWALLGQQRYVQAESLLVGAYEGLTRRGAGRASDSRGESLREAGERVVRLYEAWGRPEQAAQWREKLGVPARANIGGSSCCPRRQTRWSGVFTGHGIQFHL